MNKKIMKIVSGVSVISLVLTNSVYADIPKVRKNETIFVNKIGDEVKDKTVSVWLNSDDKINLKDKSNLKEIKNLKTDELVNVNSGYIDWNENNRDIYYQGKTDKELPVDVVVKYILDGNEIEGKDLDGKSGHLKIEIKAINKLKNQRNIDGDERDIYSPYIVITGMTFDEDTAKNIKTRDGKLAKDGKNQIVTAILTPGIKENFKDIIDGDKLEKLNSSIEIELDIENYKSNEIYSLITNEFFQNDDNLLSFEDLENGISDLEENAGKLVDASGKFKDGGIKIDDGVKKLNEGAEKLSKGSDKLVKSFDNFSSALNNIPDKIKPAGSALSRLNEGSTSLYNGVNKYTAGVDQISNNMDEFKKGSIALYDGAEKLENGLGKLKNATKN